MGDFALQSKLRWRCSHLCYLNLHRLHCHALANAQNNLTNRREKQLLPVLSTMKLHFLIFAISLFFSFRGACQIPRNDDIVRQKISFESKEFMADDYLLALGEKSNFNIIAETTNLPVEADITRRDDNELYLLMLDFANAYDLGWHRLNERTLIFTPNAGIDELTQLLANGHGFSFGSLVPSTAEKLRSLNGYAWPLLKDKQQKAETTFTVPFMQITPALKASAASLALSDYIFSSDGGLLSSVAMEELLHDKFWQEARLQKVATIGTNPVITGNISTSLGMAQALWEIPGLVRQIRLLKQQPENLELPKPRVAQDKDFEPLWKPWQRATWEKQLSNPRLDALCKLEVKRVPLKSVLEQVAQQCGVKLEAARPHNEKLVTLRVRDLKGREVLGALSSVTGATWQEKGDGEYLLQGEATPMQRALLPVGQTLYPRYRNHTQGHTDGAYEENQKYRTRLRDAVLQQVGPLLEKPEGAAWMDLSDDLRQELQAEFRAGIANHLLRKQTEIQPILDSSLKFSVEPMTDDDLNIRFSDLPEAAKKSRQKVMLTFIAADGTILQARPIWPNPWQNEASQNTAQ